MPTPLSTLQHPAKHTLSLDTCLSSHRNVYDHLDRSAVIGHILRRREALPTETGALATWNPKGETGRIPQDTYMVHHADSHLPIDWSFETCNPMNPEVFDSLWSDAVSALSESDEVFSVEKAIGNDTSIALPVQVVSDHALPMLFVDTMFCPKSEDGHSGCFSGELFQLIVLPYEKVDTQKYAESLRTANGQLVDMLITMDFERKMGVVYGLSYLGGIKKLMFTVMNALLPQHDILPLHCSATQLQNGSTAVFLGLSGTGKTTLSAHPGTTIIGDDEHAWCTDGIVNMEHGCYAKLINLDSQKEPAIAQAAFTDRPVLDNGVIVENAMVFPDGTMDLSDDRLAENSRVSYPLGYLDAVSLKSVARHPQTVFLLTADAKGVLPPIARLRTDQACQWFYMGYTSKLAGTEVGVIEPISSFSRFFGGAFMPLKPKCYLSLFRSLMIEHNTEVYLINTGWTGGPYGVGKRMDIAVSRAVVEAALSGALRDVPYREDTRFSFQVPLSCPQIDEALLHPESTWEHAHAYEQAANALSEEFAQCLKNMQL